MAGFFALFVPNMRLAVNENGGFRVGTLPFCFGLPLLPFKKHVFRMAVRLPRGSLRDAQRLLAFLLKRLHLNLHRCLDFSAAALAVSANGRLPDLGKQKRVAARSFWVTSACSRPWPSPREFHCPLRHSAGQGRFTAIAVSASFSGGETYCALTYRCVQPKMRS